MLRQSRARLFQRLAADEGLTLLEVLLAIAVLSIALTSMVVLSSTGLRNVSVSRDTTMADQYAREGMEIVRAYRDSRGWNSLTQAEEGFRWLGTDGADVLPAFATDNSYGVLPLPSNGQFGESEVTTGLSSRFAYPNGDLYPWLDDYCAHDQASWDVPESELDDPRYHRMIIIGFPSDNEASVRSIVCYQDGGAIRSVSVEGLLTNWQ